MLINRDTLGFKGTVAYWEYLFTLKTGVGYVGPGFAFVSGVVLDVILFIMVICSLPYIRRNGYFQVSLLIRNVEVRIITSHACRIHETTMIPIQLFQVFYWTHLLYWVFWIFLILHAKKFIAFFAVPGLIFIIEKIYDLEPVKKLRYGNVYISQVNLLPSRVNLFKILTSSVVDRKTCIFIY